ncbi:hypothetical protein WH47_10114 [Habropoda laboriosa]|uniref:Copia protein n=1 Tax=Habropoda laboriosa TaxID=597456 RepID=A0A0L7QNC6_9HYME|nr:hypothetical protein WH47_10114 [Habropoda laboriosa]
MARTMMAQANLPPSLWAEAVNIAAYIRAKPNYKIGLNKTPLRFAGPRLRSPIRVTINFVIDFSMWECTMSRALLHARENGRSVMLDPSNVGIELTASRRM